MNCYSPINKFYLSCWCIKERHSCADGECPRINQTQKMDLYLIELLRYQVLNGNKVGDGFVVKAWIETVRLFNGKFGLTISTFDLQFRKKTLGQTRVSLGTPVSKKKILHN